VSGGQKVIGGHALGAHGGIGAAGERIRDQLSDRAAVKTDAGSSAAFEER
jgi:hypothetical protein